MMNVKGQEMSIFQGGPSIHVDNNQQRIEEEEALQDQIRRHEELNNELQTAFADLDEEDDMNSTHNSTQQHSSYHNKNFQEFPLRSEENHMRNMLESRNRELEYVTNQLAMERKQNKSTVDEFEKRLAIADAEKERAIMTRDQTHELLVENKSKLIEIQETNDKLHSKIKSLEKENSSLVGELESTKYMLQDVQLKYNMVEKNITINADKNTDKILKQTQERHNAQMTMMQQQVECIQSKFDDLEHEYKNLEIRYKELQRSRESILIEKSETINQMNKNLEDAQRQCQELLSRPNLSQENRQLQNLVHVLENDKDELNITISRLRKKVNEQQQEMEMMDSIVQECGGINGSFSETSKFINREPLKSVNSSTPVGPEARLARVKEELCKSLNNIKNKREELKICEKQLAEKDKEIKQLKLDENKALSQLSHFRDEAIRLESKTKVLEKELEATRSELKAVQTCTNDETIEREMKKLQAENDRLEEELTNLKLNYEKLCMKNEEFMENEREWKKIAAELENLQNSSKIVEELEREKEKVQKLNDELKKLSMIEKVDRETQKDNQEQDQISTSMKSTDDECPKYEDLLTKYEKLEIVRLQLQNSNAEHLSCIRELRKELDEANQIIHNLEEKLNLKKMRDEEIEKLTVKAREFEDYMRIQTTKNGSFNSSKATCSTDVGTETSDLSSDDKNFKIREIESKARDDMAKLFAYETKTLEKKFLSEIEVFKNKIADLTEELNEASDELVVRREQVEILKFTILSERENSKKMLHERDEELEICHQKLEQIAAKRHEHDEDFEAEKQSFEALRKHLEEQLESLHTREQEMENRIREIKKSSEQSIKEFEEKYLSMKRTANNYKKYSEDKENYYKKESERIYEKSKENAEKLRIQFEKHFRDKMEGLENMYEAKIRKIENEHEIKLETLKQLLKQNKP